MPNTIVRTQHSKSIMRRGGVSLRHAVFAWLILGASWPCSAAAAEVPTAPAGGGQPFVNMQPSIAMNYLVRTAGLPGELGEIILFGGNFEILGWEFADGQLLSVSENPGLFDALGTTYGGDGQTTFALPDLRGRTPIGLGSGPGLTPRALGAAPGIENVTLSESQLPAHVHALPAGGATSSTGGSQPYDNMQPSLAMNYVITLEGLFPSRSFAATTEPADVTPQAGISDPFIAGVGLFAGSGVPSGFSPADGSELMIAQNEALFSLIGTIYGGDGQTTFVLPDLRGRAAMHFGQGPGLSNWFLGETSGGEAQTMLVTQMPGHDHGLPPSADTTGSTGGGQPMNNVQPSMGLNYIIALEGIYPTGNESLGGATLEPAVFSALPFIGEIELWAGDFAPRGWALANGQLLLIAQNTALFSLLGTTYGGDGRTTFALPDLRGRVVIGMGQGPGLTNRPLGQKSGSEAVTLTESQLPSHHHLYTPVPEPATLSMVACGAAAWLAWAGRRARVVRARRCPRSSTLP
jgi:microcystin-dependent protein